MYQITVRKLPKPDEDDPNHHTLRDLVYSTLRDVGRFTIIPADIVFTDFSEEKSEKAAILVEITSFMAGKEVETFVKQSTAEALARVLKPVLKVQEIEVTVRTPFRYDGFHVC